MAEEEPTTGPGARREDDSFDEEELVEGSTLWQDAWRRLLRNRAAMTSAIVVGVIGLAALSYELIAQHITKFDLAEQHAYVVSKPPGSRSVPHQHFSLMGTDGEMAFDNVDDDGNGELDGKEIVEAYHRWEFEKLDEDGDGALSWPEYREAPLSTSPPGDSIPSCDKWDLISRSLAPIEAKSIFECMAGDDGKLQPNEAGKLVEIITTGEVSDLLTKFDSDEDGVLDETEYMGLPRPVVHMLGTDQLGRDVLTRVIYGARISLAVGLLAAFVSFIIGVSWGATAGFIGGKVDDIMMRIVDVMYGLPFMILVIMLVSVFGQSILLLFVALGAIRWLTMARIVRGQVISLKEQEFVEAAQTVGVSNIGIIFKHLIPNALGPIIVYTTLLVPSTMLAEAFLSFLGLGIQAPLTSWGLLISEGRQVMDTAPWIIISAGIAFSVTLLALNFLGDGLRDALDPQQQE